MAAIDPLDARRTRPGAHFRQREKVTAKRRTRRHIDALGSLYAHAFAIEREAQARYRELADYMADYGDEGVARVFERLADSEAEHVSELAKKSAGLKIPRLAADEFAWLECGAPVPEAHAFIYSMMTPRMALHIALLAEERGKAFFEHVRAESRDGEVRELAGELAREEVAHVAWVEAALAQLPSPYQPNEEHPGDPGIESQL